MRAAVEGLLASQKLDAIVYPTSSRRPGLIADTGVSAAATPGAILGAMGLGGRTSPIDRVPRLIVPAGFSGDRLPVAISFVGGAFSEPRLLALGYSFEQLTHARRLPRHTPPLSGEVINTP